MMYIARIPYSIIHAYGEGETPDEAFQDLKDNIQDPDISPYDVVFLKAEYVDVKIQQTVTILPI